MPQHNLTRAEAQTRAALLSVQSYDITLVLDGQGEDFRSVTRVTFSAEEGAATFIDAITTHVESITLNGEELDPTALVTPGRIALPGLAAENVLTVDARFAYMNTGEGLHRFVDPVDDETYLYTQFEVPDARRVFPVFEQPDLKASFSFTVLAPDHWTVVSNSPTPQAGEAAEPAARLGIDAAGLSTWQFAPTPPISSYITAIIAGPYRGVFSSLRSSDGEDVELGVYCRASLFEHLDADDILDITRAGFEFYERIFGTPYPFEKYDQLFVPEFNAGAMENAGAVTFLENYVFRSRPTRAMVERRAVTILHELAHMWFGDLVTMRWWNDLWLNESFAEFMSTLATAEATEFTDAWTTFATLEKAWAYRQDQLPSTHPIVAPIEDLADVEVNFDGITYAKGASVLKQLVAWVGREEFFTGVQRYFESHAWSNTELSDLMVELAEASGRDLSAWTALWLEESGVTLMRPRLERAADGTVSALSIEQTPVELPGQPVPSLRPQRMGVGLYSLGTDGIFARTEFHEIDIDGPTAQVPLTGTGGTGAERAGTGHAGVEAAPVVVVVNDADLAYAKVRFDELSLRTAMEHLSGFTDSLTQLMVLSTVWDMVRDGELSARAYIDMLCTHLPAVTHSTGLLVQMRQLTTALTAYLPPADRPQARAQVAAALQRMMHAAPAGSDQQLQFFQGFTAHACTPEQLDELAAVLDGQDEPLPGLSLDTDLRWSVVVALAAAGRLDAAGVERWLAEDDTATGRRSAQTALAAPATPEAKSTAFTRLVDDRSLPNATAQAIARGFRLGLETESGEPVAALAPLEPFAAEYFDRVAGWWETRTLEIAQLFTLELYPPASQSTVIATLAWLQSHPAAPKGLLRLMRENLDTAERTLRCQAAAGS
ncbi:aminopeptidase N [Brevibacterium sp. NPDC049920]|uniref:Aminopeptidase N n=1 Tax=Brevibacterium pityocampae TaxID=506594 RepID=A0ABP8JG56_9MICO|nr:aminopeptidase N [uncultured Brevibacterium sp.]